MHLKAVNRLSKDTLEITVNQTYHWCTAYRTTFFCKHLNYIYLFSQFTSFIYVDSCYLKIKRIFFVFELYNEFIKLYQMRTIFVTRSRFEIAIILQNYNVIPSFCFNWYLIFFIFSAYSYAKMEEVTSTIAAFYEDANDAFSSNSSLFLNTSDYSKSASNSSTPLLDPELESMKQSLTNMRFVVQIVLVPLVMLIGVCGNSITIAVLTRKSMRSSTNFYLTALAISDMMYLVLFFILSLRHHPGMKKPETWFYWHFYRFALWLVDASSKY